VSSSFFFFQFLLTLPDALPSLSPHQLGFSTLVASTLTCSQGLMGYQMSLSSHPATVEHTSRLTIRFAGSNAQAQANTSASFPTLSCVPHLFNLAVRALHTILLGTFDRFLVSMSVKRLSYN
jgi:hypothetical protein